MWKWTKRIVLTLLALLLLAVLLVWYLLRGSLPQLDGEINLGQLSAPVSIERDELGTVTINAENEVDMARALGYVHAQERYFEMDLLRRSAAGELSELFGSMAINRDKEIRVHRLRSRVEENYAAFAAGKEDVLQAYTDGVNAGLQSLSVRPWPYLLLRAEPQPWKNSDIAMVGYAMFIDLQDESNSRELAIWNICQTSGKVLCDLITHDGTEWDAPLFGEARGNIKLPSSSEMHLFLDPIADPNKQYKQSEDAAPGSNNFAVSGKLTKDGRAIVADDMHLGLRAPNIWFRSRLKYKDVNAGNVDVSGFSLPGIPAIIVGSNRHVAWGFTNSYGDWADWYEVPKDHYSESSRTEIIKVKAAPSVSLKIREIKPVSLGVTTSIPITNKDANGTELALDWEAHKPGSLSFGISNLALQKNVSEAVQLLDNVRMPHQNALIADKSGSIAWILTGETLQRDLRCNRKQPFPAYTTDIESCVAVMEKQAQQPNAYINPRIENPESGRLWTANARVLDGDQLRIVGDAGYANGARAKQIRDGLFAKQQFTEKDLLAIQLDNRALYLERWWKVLRKQTDKPHPGYDHVWKEIEQATRQWEGKASTDAVSYRIVRAWRLAVIDRIQKGLLSGAIVKLGDDFVMPDMPQMEGIAWQLVNEEPEHLRPRIYKSWDELYTSAAMEVVDSLEKQGPVNQRTWGERNTANICHPLAAALPAFAKPAFCMPKDQLNGDGNMPMVSAPDFGASQRMVVSPGREEDGIIHMPGGQSGHILSPFWGAGHAAWVKGEATEFLPGAAKYKITAKP